MLSLKTALTGVIVLALATGAMAAGTPEQKCAAGKMKAAGKAAAAKASCYAKALGATAAVDTECLAKAQAKLDAAYAKLELAGGCITTADVAAVSAKVDTHVEDVAGDLGCSDGLVLGDEQCDDDNAVSGDGCSATCQSEACGDGMVTGGEACDDGNATNGDGCDNNCTVTACGNGIATGIEACDDGNGTNGDGCDENCTASACGNGAFDPASEDCDDGNLMAGDGCSATCTLEAACPCWSTASLDATFPAGYFDLNGRGGASCVDTGPSSYSITSMDTCDQAVMPPADPISRSGFGGTPSLFCVLEADHDPANDGSCVGASYDVAMITTVPQAIACYWNWRESAVVQAACP